MPLSPGSDRKTVSKNISEMMGAGYPQKQAVAASLSNARRHPRADGGLAPNGDNPPMPGEHWANPVDHDDREPISLDDVRKTYPGLAPHLDNAVAQWGPADSQGYMETYPPGEQYNPNPGKLTFEVYDRGLKGKALTDSLAADSLHHLGGTDEDGKPNVPEWRRMKEDYARSMTADQLNLDYRAYLEDKADDNEKRSFEDWHNNSRLDGRLRAGIWPQLNPDWHKPGKSNFTPEQEAMHQKMSDYIRAPRAFGGASPTTMNRGLGAGRVIGQPPMAPMTKLNGIPHPHMAFGGGAPDLSPVNSPVSGPARMALKELYHPGGLIGSPVAGRTDRIPMSVAADSYVIPADVVSGIGQGNSMAGSRFLDHAMKTGPWGTSMPHLAKGRGAPPPPPPWHPPAQTSPGGFAHGGVPKGVEPVKIIAAGGEYVIPPHVVKHHPMLGNGDMKKGHRVLDKFVKRVRAKTIDQLKKLPGPKKD